jgi:hypothetical protein
MRRIIPSQGAEKGLAEDARGMGECSGMSLEGGATVAALPGRNARIRQVALAQASVEQASSIHPSDGAARSKTEQSLHDVAPLSRVCCLRRGWLSRGRRRRGRRLGRGRIGR